MIAKNDKLLVSVYTDPKVAEHTYNALIRKGQDKNDISVVMSDQTRNKYFT